MPKSKLSPVFVPEAEQPYKIPHNWRWVKLGGINRYCPHTVDPANQPDAYFELYSVPSMETNYPEIIPGSEIGSSKQSVQKNDVLLCKINPHINRVWKVSKRTDYELLASSEWVVIRNNRIDPDFMVYCLKSPYFREFMLSHVSGIGGSLMRAQPKHITSYPIPLPPLAEQQRIVERIESLFTKLDAAREKAREVVDGFELRKAAILHRAFTGELTEQWRANNGASSGRKTVTIASVCHSLKYGTAKKSAKAGNVVVLRMGNLQGGEIDWSNLAYSNDEEDNEKYSLSPGDVLFNRTNSPELVGKTSIYRGEFPAIYAGYLIKLDYNRDIISGEYLNYMLNSPEAKEYCKTVKTDGVNQSNINAKRIGAFLIPLPSLNEQKETEKRLQSILRKQLQVSEAAQQVIDNIDAMKKALLGRAFRGELGTNDPSEAGAEFAVTVR